MISQQAGPFVTRASKSEGDGAPRHQLAVNVRDWCTSVPWCVAGERTASVQVKAFLLNLTSAQPEALCQFYREVVGLPPAPAISACTFHVGGGLFSIDGHSEVHGP